MKKKAIKIFIVNLFNNEFNFSLKAKDFKDKNLLKTLNINSMNIMYFLASLEKFVKKKINLNIILNKSLGEIISCLAEEK